jgi:anti-sigma factor RsiW
MRRHVRDHEVVQSFDGELSPRRRSLFARHVEQCRTCQEKTDRLRAAMVGIDALHRPAYPVITSSPDYARVRLEAALREAASSEPGWFQAVMATALNRASLSRAIGAGLFMTAVCVAAVFAVRGPAASGGRVPVDVLPQSSLTPGAVSALTAAELCNGVRPSRLVTERVRLEVLQAYQVQQVPVVAYELDALITPELGGSTDAANLWPQRYHSGVWNARVKDELERVLPEMVCRRQITLAQAQQDIATDWIAAYKRYFHTDAPLHAHLGASEDGDPELVFLPAGAPVTQVAAVAIVSR